MISNVNTTRTFELRFSMLARISREHLIVYVHQRHGGRQHAHQHAHSQQGSVLKYQPVLGTGAVCRGVQATAFPVQLVVFIHKTTLLISVLVPGALEDVCLALCIALGLHLEYATGTVDPALTAGTLRQAQVGVEAENAHVQQRGQDKVQDGDREASQQRDNLQYSKCNTNIAQVHKVPLQDISK